MKKLPTIALALFFALGSSLAFAQGGGGGGAGGGGAGGAGAGAAGGGTAGGGSAGGGSAGGGSTPQASQNAGGASKSATTHHRAGHRKHRRH